MAEYNREIVLPEGLCLDLKEETAKKVLVRYKKNGSTRYALSLKYLEQLGEAVADLIGSSELVGRLKALAFKDSASASYKPAGTVSQPTFTGNSLTSTGKFTPEGSVGLTNSNKTAAVSQAASGTATYTPAGLVAAPSISVKTAGSQATVNSITDVGTLPELTASVADEVLTLGFSAGTLPTQSGVSVKTGDAEYEASAPAFTGTAVRLVTGNIPVPTAATFTGSEGDVSVSGTPSGTVSRPTFTGTDATITVT